jgi:hypothetical protein
MQSVPISTEVQISIKARCTTLCDKVCQWLATGRFYPGPLVSSSNKTDRHDITIILLKVVSNTIKQTNKQTNKNLVENSTGRNFWFVFYICAGIIVLFYLSVYYLNTHLQVPVIGKWEIIINLASTLYPHDESIAQAQWYIEGWRCILYTTFRLFAFVHIVSTLFQKISMLSFVQ